VITEILIWSLFASSVNLLFGYVGLLSFGQALYFGFGMYGVALGFWSTYGRLRSVFRHLMGMILGLAPQLEQL
jgi:ABC-type branched-subunit amino acid transport system permease subunit